MPAWARSWRQWRVLIGVVLVASALAAPYLLKPGSQGAGAWLRNWLGMLIRVALWLPFLPVIRRLAARWPFGAGAGAWPPLRALGLVVVISAGYALALAALAALPARLVPMTPWRGDIEAMVPEVAGFVAALSYELPLAVLGGWSLLSIGWALARQRELRASQQRVRAIEASLRLARLQALEAQLHPHFLFNTLNCITALLERDRDAAALTAGRLADLFTQVADERRPARLSLRQELQLTRAYLDIQRTRFGERLGVRVEVAHDSLEAAVPALLLQPLVENALQHGLCRHARPGLVEVRAALAGDRVVITVEDDGPGFASGARTGTGLGNLAGRLRELYGEVATLATGAGEGGRGARVVVTLPREAVPAEAPPADAAAGAELPATSPAGPPEAVAVAPGRRPRPELVAAAVVVAGMFALSALWAICAHLGYDAVRARPTPLGTRILGAAASGAASWTLVGVVIFLAVRRLPFRPQRALGILTAHLAVGLLVVSPLKTAVMVLLVQSLGGRSGWPSFPYLVAYWSSKAHEHVLYYLALAGLAYALLYFRSEIVVSASLADKRAQLTDRRLASLRRRVGGYFVRRALADLPGLIARRPMRAERLISALADLLRHTLNAGRGERVRLSAELAAARLCARVESRRTGRRCRVRTRCSAGLSRQQVVPGLLEPGLAGLFARARTLGRGPWRLDISGRVPAGGAGADEAPVVELALSGAEAPPAPLRERLILPPGAREDAP